jgi:hypothetical protein
VSVPPDLISAARTAPFVFLGTVRRPGASNVEMLESPEYPTAVVRVDEVIASPEAVGDLTGRDVTVHLSGPRAPSRSSRHLFMATSLHFGDEIGVAEIGRVPRGRVERELRRAVLEEKLRGLDEALAERLSLSAAVLYGVVLRIDSVTPDAGGTPEAVGEAMPTFRAAVLTVWRALKGRLEEQEPRVVFPFPRTQKWSEVPLFVEGEEGVWILQRARGQTLAGGTVTVPDVPNGYTALDPLDFHAPGLIGRIEALLASPEAAATARRARRR